MVIRRTMAVSLGAVVALVSSCAVFEGFDELPPMNGADSTIDSAVDSGDGEDATVADVTWSDSNDTGDSSATDAGDATDTHFSEAGDATDAGNGCPTKTGPTMVRIHIDSGPSYCIDSTEVTNAQFNQFLASHEFDAPPGCALAGPAGPDKPPPPVYDDALQNVPVVSVSWCHAFAYCKWAGKRLCGGIGGGQDRDGTPSEWAFACQNGGKDTLYPYGSVYDPAKCNTEGTAPVDASSKSECHGTAWPEIYDMTGNVTEFVNRVDPEIADAAAADTAIGASWRGGKFDDKAAASCTYVDGFGARTRYEWTGIRCCADAAP